MPALKTGPLTRAELQAVWDGATDEGYSASLVAAGDGRGFEVWSQLFAQMERASTAIDVTTQAMFISGSSGQTNPPAAGAARATVTLTFARTGRLSEPLLLGAGYVWVDEETTDAGVSGPETVRTGRRYVLAADLYFRPGEPGPLTIDAVAQVEGYGYNNPRAGTLVAIEQPGTAFENDLATVAVIERPPEIPSGTRSSAIVVSANQADMFVPEHVGQYATFTDGSNLEKVGRMVRFVSPDASVDVGSSVELELLYAVGASVFAGTFEVGETIDVASGAAFARVVAEGVAGGIKHLAVVLTSGPSSALAAGAALAGLTSGATATVRSNEHSSDFVAETATAAWRVLDWVDDYGLAVSNVASPTGGRVGFLDELGDERGIGRSPGESDDLYRARIREIADVVSPSAVRRALNRSFAGYAWSLREVGSTSLPGFFFDGTNEGPSTIPGRAECDAWDVDVILVQALIVDVTGTFLFQEEVVFEDIATMTRLATGTATVAGGNMILVRRTGDVPPGGLAGTRVRGVQSGAVLLPSHAETFAAANDRFYRTWFDYEQFRGFFEVTLEQLSTGEFGFSYDDTVTDNAYDVEVAVDGFPAGAAGLYRQVYAAVDATRAGGVEFELELPDEREVENVGEEVNPLTFTGSVVGDPFDAAAVTPATILGSGFSYVTAIELEPYVSSVAFVIVDDGHITFDIDGPALGANPGDSVDVRIIRTVTVDEITAIAAFQFDP